MRFQVASDTKVSRTVLGPILAVFWLVAGCAARPPAALIQARAQFNQAQQSKISATAPLAWREAELALQRAEREWERSGDEKETEHLSYLAERRLGIARARSEYTTAQNDIRDLAGQREQLVLDARERQADQAQRRAAMQEKAARSALDEAARAKEIAERERQIALRRAQEAEQSRAAAKTAEERARELEQKLTELNAKLQATERGLMLTLGDVLFDFNQATLKPGAMQQLYPLATFLNENSERTVVIEGHTDSVGSERYNQALSLRRANAVKELLVRNGVNADRISARGLGEAMPLVSNDTSAGRQQNRRVEVIISN